jgi:hypothetical protein
MSAQNEAQGTEKVLQVSQDAIPAAQGEGTAASSSEVPATLNEAGGLKPDGEKSQREGSLCVPFGQNISG